jgi:hypothetical protein
MDGFSLSPEYLGNIIGGGRIHQLSFKTDRFSFPLFSKKHLDILIANNYKLARGHLDLTTYHLTGYNQGDYGDTMLLLGKDIELKEGCRVKEEDLATLKEWFFQMAKKASAK